MNIGLTPGDMAPDGLYDKVTRQLRTSTTWQEVKPDFLYRVGQPSKGYRK